MSVRGGVSHRPTRRGSRRALADADERGVPHQAGSAWEFAHPTLQRRPRLPALTEDAHASMPRTTLR